MVKKAFVFPGQGSQYVGMGRALCENFKLASDIFEEASESLSFDVKKLCFESNQEELTLTKNAQPAILTLSAAMFKVCVEEMGITPDIMAGHSLGEISALTCANVINFSDAVRIARKRGEFMQQVIEPGKGLMAAVQTHDTEKVKQICKEISCADEIVNISNYNSGVQVAISGSKNAVERVVEILNVDNIKTTLLNVSAPFHCALMQPAADLLSEELKKYTFTDPIYPVLSNVTAMPYRSKEEVIQMLTSQIIMPVQWVDSMTYLKREMVNYGVELGPRNVLKNMMKRNISEIPFFSFDTPDDVEALRKHIAASFIPFLSKSLGIAVATRNMNWNSEEYEKGVIEPYNKIKKAQQIIEDENRSATTDEMKAAINMLISVFKTKKVPEREQIERFQQLFRDSGTEELFKDFDLTNIER